MVTGRPLFCGASDPDQLVKIFKILGTPTPREWPDMVKLPGFKPDLPRYKGETLEKSVPRLERKGLELLQKMLQHDPKKRITAEAAMRHSYFYDLKGT